MIYDYYPGCTLKTKAKELDLHARRAALALGVEMKELEDWQCCGAVYPMAKDELATRLSPVRALSAARTNNRPLLTLCSACHHVLKRVNGDMQADEEMRARINLYNAPAAPYAGETRVLHYLEMLRDDIGFDKLKALVKKPLTGMRIGAYYGCLLLRPAKVMQFDNPENPSILEDFIRALGATPVLYPYRNECCGGYLTVSDKKVSMDRCARIASSAREAGADLLITACPLCVYNLEQYARDNDAGLTVRYFTELLAQALDVGEE